MADSWIAHAMEHGRTDVPPATLELADRLEAAYREATAEAFRAMGGSRMRRSDALWAVFGALGLEMMRAGKMLGATPELYAVTARFLARLGGRHDG